MGAICHTLRDPCGVIHMLANLFERSSARPLTDTIPYTSARPPNGLPQRHVSSMLPAYSRMLNTCGTTFSVTSRCSLSAQGAGIHGRGRGSLLFIRLHQNFPFKFPVHGKSQPPGHLRPSGTPSQVRSRLRKLQSKREWMWARPFPFLGISVQTLMSTLPLTFIYKSYFLNSTTHVSTTSHETTLQNRCTIFCRFRFLVGYHEGYGNVL